MARELCIYLFKYLFVHFGSRSTRSAFRYYFFPKGGDSDIEWQHAKVQEGKVLCRKGGMQRNWNGMMSLENGNECLQQKTIAAQNWNLREAKRREWNGCQRLLLLVLLLLLMGVDGARWQATGQNESHHGIDDGRAFGASEMEKIIMLRDR